MNPKNPLVVDDVVFLEEINQLHEKGVDYLDAILTICTKNNYEIELVAEMINKRPNLKKIVMESGINLRMLK